MGQMVATNDATKVVFRITGHGALTITAIGPDGRSITPDRLEAHGGSSLDGIVPGDEWRSVWTFSTAGCWHLHAVRVDIVGDIYFEAAVPRLVGMLFALASPRHGPIRSGQRIVFSVRPDVQPGTIRTLAGSVTICHGGTLVRRLGINGPVYAPLLASTRLTVRSAQWFRALASLTFGRTTMVRTIRFQVMPW